MAARSMRLKVAVADLIAAAERYKAELFLAHDIEVAEYAQRVIDHDNAVFARNATIATRNRLIAEALKAAAKKVPQLIEAESLSVNPEWHSKRTVSLELSAVEVSLPAIPEPPKKPVAPQLKTSRVDSDLALLRSTTEEAIAISTDDGFARYLGGRS